MNVRNSSNYNRVFGYMIGVNMLNTQQIHSLVSIIVPVFKAERFLARCIESILEQTYTNFELILVVDGSPDNSGIICDNYAKRDVRIKVIHQKNKGVSAARNAGIELAKGEYIYFCDSDDYIDKNLINDNLQIILAKNADIVCFNYFEVHAGVMKNSNEFKKGYTDLDILFPFLNGKSSRCVWNKIFSISVWKELRFPVGMNYAEDYFALSRAYILATKIVANEKAYYFYNLDNEQSLVHIKGKNYMYSDFIVTFEQLKMLENKVKLKNIAVRYAYRLAFRIYRQDMYIHFLKEEQIKVIEYFFLKYKTSISKLYLLERFFLICYLYCPIVIRIIFYCSYVCHRAKDTK